MLARDQNVSRFNEGLVRLGRELENLARRNLTSQAVHVERLYLRLLNRLYGWELRSADDGSPSFEAIDLVDDDAKVVVQVSVTRDRHKRDKVNATLAKDAMRGYANAGYRLRLCFVGEQGDSVKSSKAISNPYGVAFDQKADVLLASDLLARFEALDLSGQTEALRTLDEETGRIVGPSHADAETVARINDKLRKRRRDHPSFKLMGGAQHESGIDERLLPKGLEADQIPNSARTVVVDGERPMPFSEFIRSSWGAGEQCHLLITGEGGIGKTVALLTLATEEGFLPWSVAAVYVPLHELAQYCGDGKGADRDCVDRFVKKDFPGGKEALATACELAGMPWSGGPSLVLLMDGYNEVPKKKRHAVDEGVAKWASWPGVQVITTSRELSDFDVPHMRRLELRPLSREAVSAYLGDDAPNESDVRLWRLLETPLMLRLYASAVDFKKDKRVKAAHYLRTIDEASAGGLVWNYLQWELFRCVEDRGGGHAEGAYATAILLVAPYVCWRMESASRFTVGWEELGDLVEEACRHWVDRMKPAGPNRTLARMLRWLDGKDPFDLAENLRDVLADEVALFVESGDAYALPHQSFRDCLAAIHVRNAMEACPEPIPDELRQPLSPFVGGFLADLASDELLDRAWEANRKADLTEVTVIHNLLGTIFRRRDGDLTALDWSGMDLTRINLLRYKCGARLMLSNDQDRYCDTAFGLGTFGMQGHVESVTSIGFSPDGRLVATGSGDFTVRIWDVASGTEFMPPLTGHTGAISAVCFSPDGRIIASGSYDGTVRLWPKEHGAGVRRTIVCHLSKVADACFLDGEHLATCGSWDDTIKFWDVKTCTPAAPPVKINGGGVNAIAASPDGSLVACGCYDGSMRLTSLSSALDAPKVIPVHERPVTTVAFSPDGRYVAGGSSEGVVCLFDTVSGAVTKYMKNANGYGASSLCFSPDGETLACGFDDGRLILLAVPTGALAMPPLVSSDTQIMAVRYSPDGRLLATGSGDRALRLWSVASGSLAMPPVVGGHCWVRSVGFSPDGRLLASGSDDGVVRIWRVDNGEAAIEPLEGSVGSRVSSVCFSPDSRLVACCYTDGTSRVWDVGSGETVRSFPSPPIGEDHRLLWGRPYDGDVHGWVSFWPDGRILAVRSFATVSLWDIDTGAMIEPPSDVECGWLISITMTTEGPRLNVGQLDQATLLHEAGSGSFDGNPDTVMSYIRENHTIPRGWCIELSGGRFRSDGPYIGSVCLSGTIIKDRVSYYSQSPDGSLLAGGCASGCILLWDVATGETVRRIEPIYRISLFGLDLSRAIVSKRDKELLRQNGVAFESASR